MEKPCSEQISISEKYCIVYTGVSIPQVGLINGMCYSLQEILQKLWEWIQILATGTTSTSTTSSTTTSTTTITPTNPQFLTTVNTWNAYVKLPDDYYTAPSKYHPTIIFFPGLGEVGTDPSKLLENGPSKFIAAGWNGNVTIGSTVVQPIIISLQPPSGYPTAAAVNTRIQTLKSTYRIDQYQLHLTGLSQGGWVSQIYITGDPLGGPYVYAPQITSVAVVQAVRPDDNTPYPQRFDNFSLNGGRWLGFEQIFDGRDMLTVANRMNLTVPGSGVYRQTNFGDGGHCCWDSFYAPTAVFTALDGFNQTLYQWMLRNNKTPITTTTTSSTTTTTTTVATTTTTSSTTTTTTTAGTTTTTTTTTGPTTTTTTTSSTTTTTTTNVTTTTTTTSSTTTTTTTQLIAQFNFGPSSGGIAQSGWTSTFGQPHSGVVTATDPSGIGISTIATARWGSSGGSSAANTGEQTGNPTFAFPANVTRGLFFNYNVLYSSLGANMEINGLTAGAQYKLEILGSRDNDGPTSRQSNYYCVDANEEISVTDFQTLQNTANLVTFNNRVADSNGKIFLGIAQPPSGTVGNGNQFGIINGLRVTKV